MKTLILASTSPRRKEILSFFKIPFIQDSPHFDEEAAEILPDPAQYAITLATGKASSLKARYPHALILGADTVVQKEGRYFAKPRDAKEAREFLHAFSDQWQTVTTGLALVQDSQLWTDFETTRVKFNRLSDAIIDQYLAACHWQDKAGGYSIIGHSCLLVEKIEGAFYNVAGLPTTALQRLLLKDQINLWDHL